MHADAIIILVHPDGSSLITMHEVKFFSEDEKNEMYMTFKRLMKIIRNIAELSLGNDEKEQAYFLNAFFNEWLEIKNKMVIYIRKMKDCWEKESTIDEDLGYFG